MDQPDSSYGGHGVGEHFDHGGRPHGQRPGGTGTLTVVNVHGGRTRAVPFTKSFTPPIWTTLSGATVTVSSTRRFYRVQVSLP